MKNIYVTYDEYGSISSLTDDNMVFEQENVIVITPTFPSGYYTLTETGDTVTETNTISGTFDTDIIQAGMSITGEGIPDDTTISEVTATTITLSQNATATAEGVTLTITSTSILSNYEARVYLRAQNGSSGFYEMVEGSLRIAKKSFTIPDEFMAEGTLRVGFEIKDGEKYIRFEPFKIEIRDFVRLSGDAGRFDYTVTVSVGEVTTLAAGESATVENVGTNKDAVFSFAIPRGANVDLQKTDTHIQWKSETSDTWSDLVPLTDLKSDDVEFQKTLTHIQIRYYDYRRTVIPNGKTLWH